MTFGPVVYGRNLYAQNDYSTNPILLVALDSVTPADATANTVTTNPADTVSAPTDAVIQALTSVLADMVSPGDAAAVSYTCNLTDFLLCKEFINSHLNRSKNWVVGGVSRTVTPHIYGNVLYAKNMYSTNIALLWSKTKSDVTPGFTNQNGHKYNS